MASVLPSKSTRDLVSLPLPDLIEVQIESFKRLKREGLPIYFMKFPRLNPITRG